MLELSPVTSPQKGRPRLRTTNLLDFGVKGRPNFPKINQMMDRKFENQSNEGCEIAEAAASIRCSCLTCWCRGGATPQLPACLCASRRLGGVPAACLWPSSQPSQPQPPSTVRTSRRRGAGQLSLSVGQPSLPYSRSDVCA